MLNRSAVDKYINESGIRNKILCSAAKSEHILVDFMEKFCMNADYYKFGEAKNAVYESDESDKMKRRMVRMLELTAKLHSVYLAKKAMLTEDKKLSHKYFNKIMKKFTEIGVNVVTLKKNGALEYLPSLFRYLYEK